MVGGLDPLAQTGILDQAIRHYIRRAFVFAALDDARALGVGQTIDGFEQRNLNRSVGMYEQMHLDRAAGRNFATFERLHTVVAVEVQQFETFVQAHVLIIAAQASVSDWSISRVVNLQRGLSVEGAGAEAAGPLSGGFLGQPRKSLFGNRSVVERSGQPGGLDQVAQPPDQI